MSTTLRRNTTFLVLVALAAVCAGIVWFALPHDREVKSLGIFLFKLVPFIFATEAIARLDVELFKRYHLARAVVPLSFMVFFLYFVPKIFFISDDYPNLYYHVLVLTPIIITALVMAYRLGGGSPGNVRRLSYAMLLIMLSGLEDLAFLTINKQTDPKWDHIPAVWDWASHMKVFIGHWPTRNEAYAFIAVHVILALFVLIAPTRWFERLNPRRGRAAPAAVTEESTEPTPAKV